MEKTYGWTGSLLYIEIPSGEANTSNSLDYTQDFIGGRLLASRIYWDEVSRETSTLDPENPLMLMKDEYYQLRDWDVTTGLQRKETLEKLGLEFVCSEMESLKLLGP